MCQIICAQQNAILLNQVIVSDSQLKNFTNSKSKQVLNDSIIEKNQASLTNLLNFNSVIYFKENGLGMVSSPSFRGTTAQQTAVIWNGININSQLNGQTDFNTITTRDYNSITVQAGGSSAIYGSSAIGGSIHLNNDLKFNQLFQNDLQLNYGSFNTLGINYKTAFANEKMSTQISFSRNSSNNDYDYIRKLDWKGNQLSNINGEFQNSNLSADFGYKFNENNILKFYSQSSVSDRNLSLITPTDSKTKYINTFNRNLINYNKFYKNLDLNFKIAYLLENYKYFDDISTNFFTFGNAETLILKSDLLYSVLESLKINAIIDYNRTNGYGSSFGSNIREISSIAFLTKYQLSKKCTSEIAIRKEITNNYESPLLFSIGSLYNFNKFYSLKINGSRNFRIPSFNDLYWENGGNLNLKPENSYQIEVGNVFNYKKNNLSQTFYYIKIDDLIRWIPNNDGNWSPINTNKVNTYGAETILNSSIKLGKENLKINATYAYTVSKNLENNKQLFYVPFNKFNSSIAYSFKKFTFNYQFLYNGFVFTRSNNDPKEVIKAYKISNLSFDYDFKFFKNSKIGFQIANLLNEKYQSVEDRPLPGINFNVFINLKF